jgi:creatinine amidohydrolase
MLKNAEEMSFDEAEAAFKKTDKAVLAFGAIEVHGKHAPLGLDNYVAEDIAERLADAADAVLYPSIKYGCCKMVYDQTVYPGTLSISVKTLIDLYTEIGTELARQGAKRIIFVNGHFGNTAALEAAAFQIWEKTGSAVGVLEHWTAVSDIRAKLFTKAGHGGESETSLLMATKGGKFLKMDRAEEHSRPFNAQEKELQGVGARIYTQVVGAPNYGDPRLATKEKGEQAIAATVKKGLVMFEALQKYKK